MVFDHNVSDLITIINTQQNLLDLIDLILWVVLQEEQLLWTVPAVKLFLALDPPALHMPHTTQ